jgi:hypothetical protein
MEGEGMIMFPTSNSRPISSQKELPIPVSFLGVCVCWERGEDQLLNWTVCVCVCVCVVGDQLLNWTLKKRQSRVQVCLQGEGTWSSGTGNARLIRGATYSWSIISKKNGEWLIWYTHGATRHEVPKTNHWPSVTIPSGESTTMHKMR